MNAWLTFGALVMNMVLPFVRGAFQYSKFHITGGSCPILVEECTYGPAIVGCPATQGLSDQQKAEFWGAYVNPINGLAIMDTYVWPTELAVAILAIIVGAYITVSGFRLVSWGRNLVEYVLNYKQEKERKKNRELEANTEELYFVGALKREKPRAPIRKDASVFIILAILIFAAVSVPLHAVQENFAKDFIMMDGFGSPDAVRKDSEGPRFRDQLIKGYSGENANASSWVDCFTVALPLEKSGWMDAWIEQQEVLSFLAMI
ncbi:hypothetical protein ABW19_dt0203254 [Dactylella cylindrospora]|nr:hypothetical protein ABW19_dt0203254 [Dactylella cylindrospora]